LQFKTENSALRSEIAVSKRNTKYFASYLMFREIPGFPMIYYLNSFKKSPPERIIMTQAVGFLFILKIIYQLHDNDGPLSDSRCYLVYFTCHVSCILEKLSSFTSHSLDWMRQILTIVADWNRKNVMLDVDDLGDHAHHFNPSKSYFPSIFRVNIHHRFVISAIYSNVFYVLL
jgi:hypothetical protein